MADLPERLRQKAKEKSYRMGNVSGNLETRSEYYETCLLDWGAKCYAEGMEKAAKIAEEEADKYKIGTRNFLLNGVAEKIRGGGIWCPDCEQWVSPRFACSHIDHTKCRGEK